MPDQGSQKSILVRDRLILALDVPDIEPAKELVALLGDSVTFYKVGLELFMSGRYFELVDWLIEKNREGYVMVNSVEHLCAMKPFIRRTLAPWPCQAGNLSLVIRLDGSFAPCFELYGSDEDWGNIYEGPKFDPDRLSKIKMRCTPTCLSTCNFQVCHYSSSFLYTFQWLAKHAYSSVLGTS